MKFDGENFTKKLERGGSLYRAAWKPNGSYALVFASDSYTEFDGESFSQFHTITGWTWYSVSWKPDGSFALVTGSVGYQGNTTTLFESGTLVRFDGGRILHRNLPILYSVSWKPDGSYALAVGSKLSVIKFDGGSLTTISSGEYSRLNHISWMPNGSYALIVGENGTALKFDGANLIRLSTGIDRALYSVSWKPDGSYALITGQDVIFKFDGNRFSLINDPEGPNYWPYVTLSSIGVIIGLSALVTTIGRSSIKVNRTIRFGMDKVRRIFHGLSLARLLWTAFSLAALIGLLLPWWSLVVRYSFGGGAPQEVINAFLWKVVRENPYNYPSKDQFSESIASIALGPLTTASLILLVLSSFIPLMSNFVARSKERTFLLVQALCVTALFTSFPIGLAFNLIYMKIPVIWGLEYHLVRLNLFGYFPLHVTGGALIFATWLSLGFGYTAAVLIIPLALYIMKSFKMDIKHSKQPLGFSGNLSIF